MKNEGFTPQNMDKNPKNEGCGFPWQPVTSGLDPSYEEFVSKGQGSKPTHKVWRWKVAGFISRSHFFRRFFLGYGKSCEIYSEYCKQDILNVENDMYHVSFWFITNHD